MLSLYAQLYQQEAELTLEARYLVKDGWARCDIVAYLVREIYTDNNLILSHVDECDLNNNDIMKPLRQAQQEIFNAICGSI